MNILDKIGSAGTIAAAFGMSCCLPLFALVGSVIGLGFLAQYEYEMFYVMQAAALLALLGTIWAYRGHRKVSPVVLSASAAGLILYAVNTDLNTYLIYGGMSGLATAAGLNTVLAQKCGRCAAGGERKCS